jgi:GNAT superfamily N-acetyltransferase
VGGARARADGTAAAAKAGWLSATLLEWGCCGQVLFVGDAVAGFALYAPASYLPGAAAYATSPVSADAVLLGTVRVLPEHAGSGLGRVLVQAVAKDLMRRRVHAVEAFGSTGQVGSAGCLLPADFLRSVGFATVRPHPRTPRLRLDLRSIASWREDVEGALERLLGVLGRPEGALRPVRPLPAPTVGRPLSVREL